MTIMDRLKTYIETLSNKFTIEDDELCERDEYDSGYVAGWEQACHSILNRLNETVLSDILSPEILYECLKNIRYDKNAAGQFSAYLKDEFTDYALKDIAFRLSLRLGKAERAIKNIKN